MSNFIITYTGKKVNPLDMRPEDICFEDIAHALANKCRYTGHARYFYSVAEHSILVARELAKRGEGSLVLYGFLHDAGEAYLPDIDTSLKHNFPILKQAEKNILDCVSAKYGLASGKYKEIKEIDREIAWSEVQQLFANYEEAADWRPEKRGELVEVRCWSPAMAKQVFKEFGKKFLVISNEYANL